MGLHKVVWSQNGTLGIRSLTFLLSCHFAISRVLILFTVQDDLPPHHTPVSRKQRRGSRHTSLSFEDTSQEPVASCSLTHSWSAFSHMAITLLMETGKCSFYSRQPYGQLKIWCLLFIFGFQQFDFDVPMHNFFSYLFRLEFLKPFESKTLCLLLSFGTFHPLFLQIVFLAHSFPPGTPITCIFDILLLHYLLPSLLTSQIFYSLCFFRLNNFY